MDNVIEQVFQNLMRGEYQRRESTGFTKNINLTGWAKVPDEVREFGLKLARTRGTTFRSPGSTRPYPHFINEAQMKYIARGIFCYYFPPDTPNASILNRVGFSKLNKTRYEKLRKKVRADFATKTLASFYKRDDKINWWNVLSQVPLWCTDLNSEIKVIYRIALAIKDAMAPAGMKTLPVKYRTATVLQIIRTIRQNEGFSAMPILADALQDADFDNETILNHYRDPDAVFTFGSWIFKATGNLEYTGGSGTDKPNSETPADGA